MFSDLRRRLIILSLIEAPIIAGLVILFALDLISLSTFIVIMLGLSLVVTATVLISVRAATTRGDDEDFEF
jgi:hypothetical protein